MKLLNTYKFPNRLTTRWTTHNENVYVYKNELSNSEHSYFITRAISTKALQKIPIGDV